MGIVMETRKKMPQGFMNHSLMADFMHEVVQFMLGWQFAIDKQIRCFQKSAALGQLLDGIPPMQQYTRIAVDVSDFAFTTGRGDKTRVVAKIAEPGIQGSDIDRRLAQSAFKNGKLSR